MMFVKAMLAVAASALLLPIAVHAQDGAQGPIYVPFDYAAGEPVSASVLGSSGGATTYALIDGPRSVRVAPGPATLIKNGNAASMIYIDQANPTATYSGVCNLVTPVAMCTLNVQETGAPLPPTGGSGAPGSTNTGRPGSGGNGGTGGAAGSGVTALLIGVSTAVLGFGVGVSLLS
ncbi:hypothetical protein BJ165DRAFT_1525019 [Panaeolus papilionaceus]|nr:hypothetical protein BJ165DRAFT_1525019 [Panaeolus papilionaceus]